MKQKSNLKIFSELILLVSVAFLTSCSNEKPVFVETIIDDKAPSNLWMKSTGDINNDGLTDILAGGWEKGGMVAYLAPDWTKLIINDSLKISTDAEVCDIDRNDIPDIVAVVDSAIIWLSGNNWNLNIIDSVTGHDVEADDFDNDGLPDVVARNQGAFGNTGGHTLFFYKQNTPAEWIKYEKEIPDGEGLKMADINRDNRKDLVTNGCWYENSGSMDNWIEHKFTDTWTWPNAAIDVADINNDGLADILHSPSELSGNYYHISWFEAPHDPSSLWKEHILADSVETVLHSIGAADFDSDGKTDIVVAEMQQGRDPDEVSIFYNKGNNRWEKQIISKNGSHSMRLFDFDHDGDVDITGANFAESIMKMWINKKKN